MAADRAHQEEIDTAIARSLGADQTGPINKMRSRSPVVVDPFGLGPDHSMVRDES